MIERKRTFATVLLVGLGLTFAVGGCHDHEHGDEHAHGPEGHHEPHGPAADNGLEAIGITRFTEQLELFAEHPPAIAGQKLPFLAHLTILDGFSALEDATVTLVLDGPTRIEAVARAMLRPGIFRPTLTAPAPGLYRGSLIVAGPGIEDVVEGFDVNVFADVAAARVGASFGPEAASAITFLKEQQWQIPFATGFAEEGALVPMTRVIGDIGTPPSGQAEVDTAISGRVVAPEGGLPLPGAVVQAGQVLATIAPVPSTPEAGAMVGFAVTEAGARVQTATADVTRLERLVADRAAPQRELDEARRELRVARESARAARRTREVFVDAASGVGEGSYQVSAPISGVVVAVNATLGKAVTAGDTLFRVVNLDQLWVTAHVPERDAASLQAGQDAAYRVPGQERWQALAIAGDTPNATLVHISPVVTAASRTVDIIYGLQAPDAQLRLGARVEVAVPVGARWHGVVVPTEAILDDDGRHIVYVQAEGESFEERVVTLGPEAAGMVAIVKGVAAHERIVTRGANLIRLASRSSSTPAHGHVH